MPDSGRSTKKLSDFLFDLHTAKKLTSSDNISKGKVGTGNPSFSANAKRLDSRKMQFSKLVYSVS
jgi:hypothetical protein